MKDFWKTLTGLHRNERLYMATMTVVGFTVDGGIYAVLFNLYLLRLDYGPRWIGTVNASALLAFALFSIPAGLLGGRRGHKRMMLVGLATMVIGGVLVPLAEFVPAAWQTGWILVAYVTLYLGLALFFVNGSPFLMNSVNEEMRNRVFAVQVALWSFSAFAGATVGGLLPGLLSGALATPLTTPGPYRLTLIFAALALVIGVLTIGAADEPRPRPATLRTLSSREGPTRDIVLFALVRLLQVAVVGAVIPFFNVYLDDYLRVPTSSNGLLIGLGRLLAAPAALVTPYLAARWGNGYTVIWVSIATSAFALPLAFIEHWSAASLSFIGITTLSSIRYPAFLIYTLEAVGPRARATMSGVGEMAAGLGFTATSLGGGYLIVLLGYPSLFLTGAAISLVGTLLFWAYVRRAPPADPTS